MELSVSKFLETESYRQQREVIRGETNRLYMGKGFAHSRIANPGRLNTPDYKVFEKTDEEKGKLLTLKKKWKDEMRKKYPQE